MLIHFGNEEAQMEEQKFSSGRQPQGHYDLFEALQL